MARPNPLVLCFAIAEQTAEMAIENYRNDKDLTAFTALDGEDFYVPLGSVGSETIEQVQGAVNQVLGAF